LVAVVALLVLVLLDFAVIAVRTQQQAAVSANAGVGRIAFLGSVLPPVAAAFGAAAAVATVARLLVPVVALFGALGPAITAGDLGGFDAAGSAAAVAALRVAVVARFAFVSLAIAARGVFPSAPCLSRSRRATRLIDLASTTPCCLRRHAAVRLLGCRL
jgi:hypothetical protein